VTLSDSPSLGPASPQSTLFEPVGDTALLAIDSENMDLPALAEGTITEYASSRMTIAEASANFAAAAQKAHSTSHSDSRNKLKIGAVTRVLQSLAPSMPTKASSRPSVTGKHRAETVRGSPLTNLTSIRDKLSPDALRGAGRFTSGSDYEEARPKPIREAQSEFESALFAFEPANDAERTV